MWEILLITFGLALSIRLRYRIWQLWLAWGITTIIFLTVLIFFNNWSFRKGLIALTISSLIGFLGPEVWEATRETFRRPRTWGIIFVLGGVYYIYTNPQILNPIASLLVAIFGFLLIIRALLMFFLRK